MKHKIIASNLAAFDVVFDSFLERCKQTNEHIVRAKYQFNEDHGPEGYRATVWTKQGGAV